MAEDIICSLMVLFSFSSRSLKYVFNNSQEKFQIIVLGSSFIHSFLLNCKIIFLFSSNLKKK